MEVWIPLGAKTFKRVAAFESAFGSEHQRVPPLPRRRFSRGTLLGGWKIILFVRTHRIYGRQAVIFLNPIAVPTAGFADSMAKHSKQGVGNTELKVLNDLHVVRRDDDAEVAEPGHLAPIESS